LLEQFSLGLGRTKPDGTIEYVGTINFSDPNTYTNEEDTTITPSSKLISAYVNDILNSPEYAHVDTIVALHTHPFEKGQLVSSPVAHVHEDGKADFSTADDATGREWATAIQGGSQGRLKFCDAIMHLDGKIESRQYQMDARGQYVPKHLEVEDKTYEKPKDRFDVFVENLSEKDLARFEKRTPEDIKLIREELAKNPDIKTMDDLVNSLNSPKQSQQESRNVPSETKEEKPKGLLGHIYNMFDKIFVDDISRQANAIIARGTMARRDIDYGEKLRQLKLSHQEQLVLEGNASGSKQESDMRNVALLGKVEGMLCQQFDKSLSYTDDLITERFNLAQRQQGQE